MANVASTKQPTITSHQEGTPRITKLTVDWEDIVNAGTYADNDTASFSIPVKAGTLMTNIAVKLVTAFTDSGSGDELNVEAGLTGGDVDAYIATAALHDSQSEITYVANTGAEMDNENGVVFTAADSIDFLFTPNVSTGTDYSLDELTAGEVLLTVQTIDLN